MYCYGILYSEFDCVPSVEYRASDLFTIGLCVFPLGLSVTDCSDIYWRLICSVRSIEQANRPSFFTKYPSANKAGPLNSADR